MVVDQKLRDLMDLFHKTSVGPWEVGQAIPSSHDCNFPSDCYNIYANETDVTPPCPGMDEDNVRFIVAAHTAFPHLVVMIEALKEKLGDEAALDVLLSVSGERWFTMGHE